MYLEGDFVKDIRNIIYDVKGFEHPEDKVVAYPRYIPDKAGDREVEGIRYRKIYDLEERYDYINQYLHKYFVYDNVFDSIVPEIPREDIIIHYKPSKVLIKLMRHKEELNEIEKDAIDLTELLMQYAGIKINDIGISGSIMVGLYTKNSDIDLIIYGKKATYKILKGLEKLYKENILRQYTNEEIIKLYKFRKAYYTMDLKTFMKIESRKMFQGIFRKREYFIRFLRDPEDMHIYGNIRYIDHGYAYGEGYVLDDSEAIYTPCKYLIKLTKFKYTGSEDINIEKPIYIMSHRGRFSGSLYKGETFKVYGKLEGIMEKNKAIGYRLLLGESYNDYLMPLEIENED